MNTLIKNLLFIGGCIFLVLAVAGIFLPLLPTTPFLLLSAACYVRSSQQLYNWLMNNKLLGKYIRNYREGNGITLRAKMLAIAMLWGTILYSALVVVKLLIVKIILILIAAGVTVHLISLKTYKDEELLEEDEVSKPRPKKDIQSS